MGNSRGFLTSKGHVHLPQCTVKPSRSKVHLNDSTYNNVRSIICEMVFVKLTLVNIEDPLKETCLVEDNWEEFTTEENTSLSMSASISRMNNDSGFEGVCIEKEGQIQVVETSVSKTPSTFVILEEADGNLQSQPLPNMENTHEFVREDNVLPTHVPDKRNKGIRAAATMNQKIDKKSFTLPNYFGTAVDGKMTMNRRLNHLDFQAITRVLALAISEHTIAPTTDCLKWVVSKLFDTYGKAIMADPNNEDVSMVTRTPFQTGETKGWSETFRKGRSS
ncbi:Uncharacterized protein APZ42_005400 [Daphnia magna]|uniref:Uncharacterized protein n=1 Tax=Daphnia magna TaxID=35525 RepID=A0A164GH02_9CRUS|nr:Uncharacterized protein APZ42_005400 [Daphnia magna]